MNFIEISKLIMNGEKIYNIPLRVCFYARVSTDTDVQLNSLENQLNYYKNFIKNKEKWTYVDGYIDEGKSGVRIENRDAFKKMINDATNNKFDLIITKEVSRFARDLEDSIHYIRMLKDANVGIYFENQNLNTYDINSELILNIMFNLAQDESRKLSSRVKFGHREAIKKGHVLGSNNIIGYQKDNCKLIINDNEAKFIKTVFELYSTGNYGFYKLSKKLSELGYHNKSGNLYDKDTLKRIIKNPKYKGFYRGKTTETIDYRTKKRIKIDNKDQIIYKSNKDIIPPIVSEELWDLSNEILNSRTKNYTNNNHFTGGLKYPLSSKIYCKEHNTHFQRSHGNKFKNRPTWSCGKYLQYRLSACISPIIAEIDLYNILKDIMNNLISNKNIIINNLLSIYKSIDNNNQYNIDLLSIDKNIKEIEDKKTLAFDMILKKEITKDTLKNQLNHFENEINKFKSKKEEIIKQINISKQNNSINQLKKHIKEELNNGINEEFIRKFINKIIVSKIDNNRNNILLDIHLNLFNENNPSISLYIKNKKYNSIETKKKNHILNEFTCNVYLKTL